MFDISKKYNLDICSPTYKNDESGKISHSITKQQNGNLFRYTNFLEVGCSRF